LEFARAAGSKLLRVYGSIAIDAPPEVEEIAIADPAEYAAIALKAMLEARGIRVTGVARAEHRLARDTQAFSAEAGTPISNLANPITTWRVHRDLKDVAALCKGCEGSLPPAADAPVEKTLAAHNSYSVPEDVVVTNKVSQNLHAELLLHQLGAAVGSDGSTAQGARVVRSFAISAGVDKDDFVFYDGSGLSGHDLVAPRAIARLLRFAAGQPWFAEYKASLPVGGVDGSLVHRFAEAPLKGHVFAKTGSLGESRALSGYLECASGRTVIFSVMVDNHAPGSNADREVMDRIVAAIAAAE
jgi:D-alanyl-D-alanine carboxypeptidase/D-alanyl-D-alanine-endopeptidase (penicillin-binding protein 4)